MERRTFNIGLMKEGWNMKYILGIWVTFAAVLMLSMDAEANEITNMHMEVEINPDGSVTVTETREADMTEGTEN